MSHTMSVDVNAAADSMVTFTVVVVGTACDQVAGMDLDDDSDDSDDDIGDGNDICDDCGGSRADAKHTTMAQVVCAKLAKARSDADALIQRGVPESRIVYINCNVESAGPLGKMMNTFAELETLLAYYVDKTTLPVECTGCAANLVYTLDGADGTQILKLIGDSLTRQEWDEHCAQMAALGGVINTDRDAVAAMHIGNVRSASAQEIVHRLLVSAPPLPL